MPNLTDTPEPRTLLLPLPGFRQPVQDPPLPEVTDDQGPETAPAPGPPPTSGPLRPSPTSESPAPQRIPSLEAPTPTPTSSRAGDPKVAGEVLAGLFALACGYAAWFFGRRRMTFRQPTERQIDEISTPLGNLAARHLPTEFISKDLVDATHAAGAVHRYLIAGPMVTRDLEPIPTNLGDDQ
jgi:hypothetical protein